MNIEQLEKGIELNQNISTITDINENVGELTGSLLLETVGILINIDNDFETSIKSQMIAFMHNKKKELMKEFDNL